MTKVYTIPIDDPIFKKYAKLKKRINTILRKTVKRYDCDPLITVRVKRERVGDVIFDPVTLKIRRVSSGITYTLAGDVLHIIVADLPDVKNKMEKANEVLKKHDYLPVQVPDKDANLVDYVSALLEVSAKFKALGRYPPRFP